MITIERVTSGFSNYFRGKSHSTGESMGECVRLGFSSESHESLCGFSREDSGDARGDRSDRG